jgi:(E)-4-hydroxy-3-methylbut-2-enyl-diphosphate synthase
MASACAAVGAIATPWPSSVIAPSHWGLYIAAHVFNSSLAHYRAPPVPPDHGRQRPRRRRCPDYRADHDQHADRGCRRDDQPDPSLRGRGRGHHPRVLPHGGIDRTFRADIHFHYTRALEAADKGAACLRINPGNIGSSERVAEVVRAAKANGCAIRIGVNAGSLEKDLLEKYGEPCPEALIESALDHIKLLQDHDFHEYKVAVKASDVFLAVAAYHGLAEAVDCPLHLGITEAGGLIGGTVKSSIGIGSLLWAGIGDTIRVSLSAEPEQEVKVGFEMLKALGLRTRGVRVVSCPSCSRQGFDVIRTVETLEKRLEHIKTPMSLSVLGCVVNGPGEARETDIGITGGGAGKHMVFLSGVTDHHVKSEDMLDHIVSLVEAKAAQIEAGEAVAFDPHATQPAEAAE